MSTISYIAGFRTHAAIERLVCEACAENLVTGSRKLQARMDVMVKFSVGDQKF